MSIIELLSFISTKNPIYVNGDFKIMFYDNSLNGGLINVKHYGWNCPSIYKDGVPLENGCGELVLTSKNQVINFESFEYSQMIYLSIEFVSFDVIRIRYDRCGNCGLLLYKTL